MNLSADFGMKCILQGVLPSGNVVAVKQLFVKTAQGHDDFMNEVVLITGMKHRNLVNLKGCCRRESQKLLVYEYVDNFDVDQILLGRFVQHVQLCSLTPSSRRFFFRSRHLFM